MLEQLAGASGAVVSAEELLEHVWDAHADPFSNTVAVTVARLRRKLRRPAADPDRRRRRLPAVRMSSQRPVAADAGLRVACSRSAGPRWC